MMQCWQTFGLMLIGQAGKKHLLFKKKNVFSA
jgi:hypothetical protein